MKAIVIALALLAMQPSQAELGASAAPASQPWMQGAAAAEQLFREARYVEASATFEYLWDEFGQPEHLFNAGVARFAAGHYAHAIKRLEAYLELPNIKDNLRSTAREQLDAAERECGVLTIGVTSTEITETVEVEVEYVGAGEPRPKLVVAAVVGRPGMQGTVQQLLLLDPGVWRVSTSSSEGVVATQATVEMVKRGTRAVQLELRAEQEPEPEVAPLTQPRRKLGFGFLGGGAVLTVTGAVVLGIGQARLGRSYENVRNSTCETADCFDSMKGAITLRSSGGLVLGTGLGAVGVGGIAFVKQPRMRKIAWISTAVVGGGLVVAGSVLNITGVQGRDKLIGSTKIDDFDEMLDSLKREDTQYTVGALVLGVGIGAFTSSVIGLIDSYLITKRTPKTAKRIQIQPTVFGQTGAVLSGRF